MRVIVPDLVADCPQRGTVASDVPNGVPVIVHELVQMRGKAPAEECIVLVLAAVAGSAIAALGQERAYQLLATELFATAEWVRTIDAESNIRELLTEIKTARTADQDARQPGCGAGGRTRKLDQRTSAWPTPAGRGVRRRRSQPGA